MNLHDLQPGDDVFIKSDIKKSLGEFGTNQYKQKMAGTRQVVHSIVDSKKIRIKRIDNSSFNEHRRFWDFHIDDIEIDLIEQKVNEDYKTPSLFDIKNLVL